MKKIYLFALIGIFVSITKMQAYDFTANDVNGNTIYYTKIGGDSVEVSNNGGIGTYSGDIIIPSTVVHGTEKYLVTTIGESAFWGSTLSSLNLPIGIQVIKGGAFFNSHVPGELYLPNLHKLGGSAFRLCWSLKKIQFPNLKQVGEGAIADCYDLEKIILPNDLETLSGRFFDSDILMKTVQLPSTLKAIPYNCFRACWTLLQITIPDSVESIGYNAFFGCNRLKTLIIPKNVKTIGDSFVCAADFRTCGTWWGGNWYDPDRVYPSSPHLQSIYFEGTTPPKVTTATFANVIKANVTCYVPEEALELYKADTLYTRAFKEIVGYHVGESEVEDITTSAATLKWLPDTAVTQYDINVYTVETLFAHYIVDGKGQIISSQKFAPAVYQQKMDSAKCSTDYFIISLNGMSAGTSYTYTIEGTNVENDHIYHEEGSFTTLNENEEGLFDVISDEPNRQVKKIIRDGQICILREEKVYTVTGQEVRPIRLNIK